ncbi:MAG: ribonuclease P protein component [Candidatus Paceibacterota bacterium]|jgi:ribonuclease P protein component
MLPKENRLKRKKEFEAVFKEGKTLKGNYVFLKYSKEEDEKTKIGFVVSKKVSKLAVIRNKAKRRMREIVRLRKKEIKDGMRIIIIALSPIKDAGYEEIEKDIANLLEKIK